MNSTHEWYFKTINYFLCEPNSCLLSSLVQLFWYVSLPKPVKVMDVLAKSWRTSLVIGGRNSIGSLLYIVYLYSAWQHFYSRSFRTTTNKVSRREPRERTASKSTNNLTIPKANSECIIARNQSFEEKKKNQTPHHTLQNITTISQSTELQYEHSWYHHITSQLCLPYYLPVL